MTLLLPINLVLYVLSAVLLWRSLARTTSASWLLLIVPLAAIVTHAIVLWDYLNADHFDHLNITTSLSTVALLLAAFTLMRSRRAGGLLLSPIIYVFAAVSVLLMVLSPANWGAQLSEAHGLVVHIILSLIAYAVLSLATLYAIQLLYLNYLLKHHRTHTLTGYLPPLMTVERYFFRLLSTGTALLLIAIISGFVFLNDMFAQGQSHKTILSLIAFALYAIVLYLHGVKRARGRALVITSVIASIILSLAYFGSRFVKDILLSL
ncbi:cytochrome C assembly family protein [Pseudidiomarina sp.]|uniref:cytochrome C assembly family protein n=1 Tax=Pseudidiomarina sp. TaxID=2081707 RepID=UPI003A9879AA